LGRWALYAALFLSISISSLLLLPKLSIARQASRWLGYYMMIERGLACSLLIFLFVILIFLTRYPVPLSRNVIVHCGVYTVFFLTATLAMLLRTLFGFDIARSVNVGISGVNALCAVAWFFCLTPYGEARRVSLPKFDPEHEERILHKLNALNRTVLKAAKKDSDSYFN
jgi:hypothetical protein